jgi:hypothetical protein
VRRAPGLCRGEAVHESAGGRPFIGSEHPHSQVLKFGVPRCRCVSRLESLCAVHHCSGQQGPKEVKVLWWVGGGAWSQAS